LQLDIIVPVVMSCALLWWVSRGMSWTTRLVVTAITLVSVFYGSSAPAASNAGNYDIGGAMN
jgi:hypothetical protein